MNKIINQWLPTSFRLAATRVFH